MVWYDHSGWISLKKNKFSSLRSSLRVPPMPLLAGIAFLLGWLSWVEDRVGLKFCPHFPWKYFVSSEDTGGIMRWDLYLLLVCLYPLMLNSCTWTIVLPTHYKNMKTKWIPFSPNRTWLHEGITMFWSESSCLVQKIQWMSSLPLANTEIMFKETSRGA